MLAAVKKGHERELAEQMRQDPGFNVNMVQDELGWTLLHYACHQSHRSAVIPILLAHPDIDVNAKDTYECTPFYYASADGNTPCVREMLKDSRVKVNEPTNNGFTPLWKAVRYGHLNIIKWWIAAGKEMDFGKPGDVDRTDAIGIARKKKKTEIATLLERFKSDATRTRHLVRVELGLLDDLAAEMFALVVFVSDGLLQIKDTTIPTPAARFFAIARQLPLELQMVLCYRLVGSEREIIPVKDSEVAFKELARKHW